MSGDLLCLGVITGAHGIRGEVRIKTFTETPEAIASYGALRTKSGDASYKVKRHRIAGGLVIAALKGVNNRNAAEALKGTELYVRRDSLPELEDEDEFYHSDLIGLEAELGDGTLFGMVVKLENFGGGTVVEIRQEGGDQMVYVPFTREAVPKIEIEQGRIFVAPPEEIE